MTDFHPGFWSELKRRPILWAFAAIWLIDAGMNTIYGYRRAAGVGAIGYACAFFSIAVVAAWLPVQIRRIRGMDWSAWVKRVGLSIPLIVCLTVSQFAGWAVMGVTIADGQAAREDRAMARATIRARLKSAREEYTRLAADSPGDPATLRTALEETRAAADREAARGGCGPKCEALKLKARQRAERLAAAERAAELEDSVIPGLEKRLAEAPKTAGGAPAEAVPARMFGVSDEEVRFWWKVFLVGAIGMFANLGFGMAYDPAAGGGPAAPPEWETYQPRLGYHPGSGASREAPYSAPAGRAEPPTGGRASGAYPGPDGPGMQGIHLHLSGASVPPSSAPDAAPDHSPGHVPSSVLPHSAGAGAPAAASPGPRLPSGPEGGGIPSPEKSEAPAPAASDRPANRERIRALTDQLLTFRARCLADSPGGVVEAGRVYAVYAQWAGERALARPAFETMFEAATGVSLVNVAGVAHFADVALRAPELQQVSGD